MKAELDKFKEYKLFDSQKLSGWPESALVFDPTSSSSEAPTGRDNEYDDTPVVE